MNTQPPLSGGRTVEVACLLDIEQTPESFHAYAVPEDIEIQPGDRVLVHGAPSRVAFGETIHLQTRATVRRAGPLLRAWTRARSVFDITELYEVGFERTGP